MLSILTAASRGKLVAVDIALGLHFFHAQRILHLDIKYASRHLLA